MLTSVGLDHTEWLGETEAEIAAEKLAVLRDHSTLVLGRVSPEVARSGRADCRRARGAGWSSPRMIPARAIQLRAAGRFQRRNFALACAAAEAFLGELDPARVAEVAATLTVPGRLERIAADPPTFLDAAHNPDGAEALAEALSEIAAGATGRRLPGGPRRQGRRRDGPRPRPSLERVVCTELAPAALASRGLPGVASHSTGKLAQACEAAGLPAEQVPDFATAVRRARELASGTPSGVLLITGSHYVLAPARAALDT